MEQKNIVATIYLKNGQAVRGLRITPRWRTSSSWQSFTMTTELTRLSSSISLTMMRSMRRIFTRSRTSTATWRSRPARAATSTASRTSKSLSMPDGLQVIAQRRQGESASRLAEEASKRFGKDRSSCRWRTWTSCSNIRRR